MEVLKKIKNNSTKKSITAVLLVTIFGLLVGYVFYLYSQERTLSDQVNSLKDLVESATDKSKKVSTENDNLRNAINALQEQVGEDDIEAQPENTPQNEAPLSPQAELFVTDLKKRVVARSNANYDFLAISLTIVNRSKSNQAYDINQFYMISDTGKIFKPAQLMDPAGDKSWYGSELIPGGRESVTFITLDEARLVSIVFTDPATGIKLTAALPVPS